MVGPYLSPATEVLVMFFLLPITFPVSDWIVQELQN